VGTGDRRLRERYAAAGAADLVQPTESDWVPGLPSLRRGHRRGRASRPAPRRPGTPDDLSGPGRPALLGPVTALGEL